MSTRTIAVSTLLFTSVLLGGCGHDAPSACAPGADGCSCVAQSTCDDGLACDVVSDVCFAPRTATLPAIDPAARSCEVLIEDGDARVVGALFDASVRGELVRQSPKTAVTFFSASDAAMHGSAIRIQLAGSGGMNLRVAHCFDRSGRPIAGGGIPIGG